MSRVSKQRLFDAERSTNVMGLHFHRTCDSVPEQYDVFKGGQIVGYVRCRHGIFRVECRNEMVLEERVAHHLQGVLDDGEGNWGPHDWGSEQRRRRLEQAACAIKAAL